MKNTFNYTAVLIAAVLCGLWRAEATIITEASRSTGGSPQIVSGTTAAGLQNGSRAYVDRIYTWRNVPEQLVGVDYVMTYNDDKRSGGLGVSYSVTLATSATLYVLIDDRYVDSLGQPPFDWLTDASSGAVFSDTGLRAGQSDPCINEFYVYSADVSAGTYTFGAVYDYDSSNRRSFYGIAAGSSEGVSAVPEPATIFLLGLGCLVLVRKPKR
jgi:hypothetical protein